MGGEGTVGQTRGPMEGFVGLEGRERMVGMLIQLNEELNLK